MTAETTEPQNDLLDEHYESADVALTRRLKLRPTVYFDNGPHLDQRPCPSWCWVGQSNGEYHHEIAVSSPTVATHTAEGTAHVLASCYEGYKYGDGAIHTATLEFALRNTDRTLRASASAFATARRVIGERTTRRN